MICFSRAFKIFLQQKNSASNVVIVNNVLYWYIDNEIMNNVRVSELT